MLSKEAIDEFKSLYQKKYKTALTDEEAFEYGLRLVNFVRAVYGDNLNLNFVDKPDPRRDN